MVTKNMKNKYKIKNYLVNPADPSTLKAAKIGATIIQSLTYRHDESRR